MVDAFDKRLSDLSGQHAAAVASGTAALDLLMQEFNVGPGDNIIASSLTFVATVGPALHRGATPVFVDSDPATGLISIPLLRKALRNTRRVKCVIAVDLYGQCCDYDAIESLCAEIDSIRAAANCRLKLFCTANRSQNLRPFFLFLSLCLL